VADEAIGVRGPGGTTLARLSWIAAAWALWYALYRGYYALGGAAWLPGRPAPAAHFRLINAVAAVILVIAAALPPVMLAGWHRPRLRSIFLVLSWVIAVGCCMHAVVDMTGRVLSLTGHVRIPYPVWTTIDRREADLQDLFFNEPWFLIEGLLFGAIAGVVMSGRARRVWYATAVAAVAVLGVFGILSTLGVIGRAIVL